MRNNTRSLGRALRYLRNLEANTPRVLFLIPNLSFPLLVILDFFSTSVLAISEIGYFKEGQSESVQNKKTRQEARRGEVRRRNTRLLPSPYRVLHTSAFWLF